MNQNLINEMKNLHNVLAKVEQLRGGMALRCSRNELKDVVDALLCGVPNCRYPTNEGFELYRGRIENDKILNSPSEFSYCPVGSSSNYGRCHSPNTTIFYGASNTDTVLSELSPEIGDIVHVGVANVSEGYNPVFTAIGELDHIRRFDRALYGDKATEQSIFEMIKDLDSEVMTRALLVDAFFAEVFSKPATKDNEYKITSALIELLLAPNRYEGDLMDGVAYPSVAHRGGNNYVVRAESFDEKFEWKSFTSLEVTENLGYGLYTYKTIARCHAYNGEQTIEWEKFSNMSS